MSRNEIEKIETVFRTSESHDELFDAFRSALDIKLSDIEIYKILIANPALSSDEIKMFSEKLLQEFPEHAFDILLWNGKIFENKPDFGNQPEEAFNYYKRAFNNRPTSYIPLLKILNLYNYDIDFSLNSIIADIVENSLSSVHGKSHIYYALSEHYKKIGDRMKEIRYFALAEKASEREKE